MLAPELPPVREAVVVEAGAVKPAKGCRAAWGASAAESAPRWAAAEVALRVEVPQVVERRPLITSLKVPQVERSAARLRARRLQEPAAVQHRGLLEAKEQRQQVRQVWLEAPQRVAQAKP